MDVNIAAVWRNLGGEKEIKATTTLCAWICFPRSNICRGCGVGQVSLSNMGVSLLWIRKGRTWYHAAFQVVLLALVFLVPGVTRAQSRDDVPEWEMRVCADPNNLPFSNNKAEGFDNRIAAILAQDLHARLTYLWWPQGLSMVRDQLRKGECDLIIGVVDGYQGLLTTLAYYQSPYVFVYRASSPFDIESLDDSVLQKLRIGVEVPGVPPHVALVNRGLLKNVVVSLAHGAYTDPNPRSPIVEAVTNGEVDVAIVWGPIAGYFAKRYPDQLKLVPVYPEIDPPFLLMTYAMTIAVRPGDEALRDRLNIALARRWHEIQAVLEEYSVPLDPLPEPEVGDVGA